MVNGGGFNSTAVSAGTDYSTQDAAQLALTDLANLSASTTLTSVTGGFTAAMVGNIIHIASGTNFIAGWYEITAYTDTNTVTIDRTANASLNASVGVGKVGGSLNVGGSLEDDFFEEISGANATDGITVYFYNNASTSTVTFTPSEAITITGAGGTQAPIKIIGYKTTRGDNPTGTSRPTIACGVSTLALGVNFELYNLILTGTGNPVLGDSTNDKIINCKFTNSSTTADRNATLLDAIDSLAYNCEGVSYRGRALSISGAGNMVIACYLHNSNVGLNISSGTSGAILNNLIESNVTGAIGNVSATTVRITIVGNTLYGSEQKTGTGINLITTTTDIFVLNNIIYGFVTGVSHADTQTIVYLDYNDYFNNTTNRTNVATGSNDQALDPTFTSVAQVTGTTATYAGSTLTDAAANFSNVVDDQDFVLIVSGTGLTTANCQYLITSHTATTVTTSQDAGESSASNWVHQVTTGRNFAIGTNLKALGFPGAFQAGLTTGYMDIGAVQRQEAGGGGGRGARFINN